MPSTTPSAITATPFTIQVTFTFVVFVTVALNCCVTPSISDATTVASADGMPTATNARVHDLIRENLHRSPMYSGTIAGIGPRYCPSIEDKVVKFPERSSHHIFIEPEGLETTA